MEEGCMFIGKWGRECLYLLCFVRIELTFFVSTKKSNKEKRKHAQKLLRSVVTLEKRTPSASLHLNAFFP